MFYNTVVSSVSCIVDSSTADDTVRVTSWSVVSQVTHTSVPDCTATAPRAHQVIMGRSVTHAQGANTPEQHRATRSHQGGLHCSCCQVTTKPLGIDAGLHLTSKK